MEKVLAKHLSVNSLGDQLERLANQIGKEGAGIIRYRSRKVLPTSGYKRPVNEASWMITAAITSEAG